MLAARLLPLLSAATLACQAADAQRRPVVLEPIDRVWSGNDVRYALAVTGDRVFVGYYDANRQLTVASRPRRDAAGWRYHKLESWVGWDSHNGVALGVDATGQLHVAANMHNDPLVYFRTSVAGDVRSLVRVPVMVDPAVERRMTYPLFLHDAAGRLIFKYRDGGSGNGNERYNVYDAAANRWAGLLAMPLIDGEGRRNAYPVGPALGPDGRFHLVWVWRDTPDAATNHDLSYARSRDLVHWERSDGTPLTLPIRLAGAEIVDPVPVGGGMINNNTAIGFDARGRPTITFHKFDARGNTQIYLARREQAGWRVVQASAWKDFRWEFGGGGSLVSRLRVSGAVPEGKRLRVSVERDGKPLDLLLDTETLARIGERGGSTLAWDLDQGIERPAGMRLNTVEDAGGSGYALLWPSRPASRDVPAADIPEPTTLLLVGPVSAPR